MNKYEVVAYVVKNKDIVELATNFAYDNSISAKGKELVSSAVRKDGYGDLVIIMTLAAPEEKTK